jgi:hypothetical protein
MPEPITLSVIAVSALTGLAGDFLKGVAKKSAAGLTELFKGDESRTLERKKISICPRFS